MADMDLTTYTGLKAAVASFLNRTDLTESIPGFIVLAEAQMNRVLRVQRMIQKATPTITAGNDVVSLPTGFLEAITFRLADSGVYYDLQPTTLEQIVEAQSDSATSTTPRVYAISGTSSGREIQLYPAPDKAYTAALVYYGKPTALSGSNPSNWILAEAPDAYLYGALLQSAPFLRDEGRIQVWQTLYESAVTALQTMDRTITGVLRTEFTQLDLNRNTFDINTGL